MFFNMKTIYKILISAVLIAVIIYLSKDFNKEHYRISIEYLWG